MSRVIIHDKGDGLPPTVYTEGEIEVIWVCDQAPDDRFYQATPQPIPDDLAKDLKQGSIGFAGDDQQKHTKALRAVAEIKGERHLSVVSADGPDE